MNIGAEYKNFEMRVVYNINIILCVTQHTDRVNIKQFF